jgi:hypothetical protein
MKTSGMNGSSLEHAVPEQMFSTQENPVEGISAVKALQIANNQGIPIYTIKQSNINTILPQLQVDADVKTAIQNAVNAGKEVTVSKTNITLNGWTGCGYIIINPSTGAGAYMISGGLSGAAILLLIGAILLAIGIFAELPAAVVLAVVTILITLIDNITSILIAPKDDPWKIVNIMIITVTIILAIAGIFSGATPAYIAVSMAWLVICFMLDWMLDQLRKIYPTQTGLHWRKKQWMV